MTIAQRMPPPRKGTAKKGEVLLGEDWVAPDALADQEFRAVRGRRSVVALNRSPLARKITLFNLMALVVLVAGVLYLNPHREGLVLQRQAGLVAEAKLITAVLSANLPDAGAPTGLAAAPALNMAAGVLDGLTIGPGVEVIVFDAAGKRIASKAEGMDDSAILSSGQRTPTFVTGFLNGIWNTVSAVLATRDATPPKLDRERFARGLLETTLTGKTPAFSSQGPDGGSIFSVAAPILDGTAVIGAVTLTSTGEEIDQLVRQEREQILQMFFIALLVSIGLSFVLASTIANPLSDLAAAAELGRDRDTRKISPGRVRIPDLTARPDEIGRLSVAMRGMVAALYDRIDSNEQFAADVAHEIKNPLASLRSAVGTMRVAKRDDQREKLLEVIEHDVRRLDRLVSDISNASRLDSELVKEEEEEFNLLKTVSNLTTYLGKEAGEKGVEFITDLPDEQTIIRGLEGRLAQVFVNLITNAISFCEDGDAVRVWARRRGNRVLVVVEDTGPGIPEQALTKVFKRFYSERPEGQFGNHSGLGLAISKQIVEAHGGVIWAENIRPTDADITSDPLGARFVVGLPV
jgi:two-component system, OmpR family, sensor histidine kinase ChvG